MAFWGLTDRRYLRGFFKAKMEVSMSMVLGPNQKLAPGGLHWVIIQEDGRERPLQHGSWVLNVTQGQNVLYFPVLSTIPHTPRPSPTAHTRFLSLLWRKQGSSVLGGLLRSHFPSASKQGYSKASSVKPATFPEPLTPCQALCWVLWTQA